MSRRVPWTKPSDNLRIPGGVKVVSKGPGAEPGLFLGSTILLQIAEFTWRARQDSNLRPSDS